LCTDEAIRTDPDAPTTQRLFVLNIRLRTVIALAIVGLVLFLLAPTLVTLYTDWLWFGEVGYEEVSCARSRRNDPGRNVLVVAFAVFTST
jgi:hypothetical protein